MNERIKMPDNIRILMGRAKEQSDDPDTQTAAIIWDFVNHEMVSYGTNTLPDNIKAEPFMLERPEKYKWIEHAERNAIFTAAYRGYQTQDCEMWIDWYPCIECARAIIQSGICRLYCKEPDWTGNPKWSADFIFVREMFKKCELEVIFYDN